MKGYRVNERIEGAHRNPRLFDYPLLPDDLLVPNPDGTWTKEAPGLCVGGFVLTDEQAAALEPVEFRRMGLTYEVVRP